MKTPLVDPPTGRELVIVRLDERRRGKNDSRNAALVLERLQRLRVELIDQAFVLECQGRLDAADVAVSTANRMAEVFEELSPFASDRRRSR